MSKSKREKLEAKQERFRKAHGLRRFMPAPKGFDPIAATDRKLLVHGYPARPDAERHPELLERWTQLVGVVGDAKYTDLRTPAPPTAYVPITQAEEHIQSYQAVVRIDGPAAPLASAARTLATQIAPSIPAPEMTSMETIVDESLASERMMALLSVFFAICALAVTAVGLYGTLAYATARRTSEIGIRMALGAQRAQVAQMVFGQNLWVVLGGASFGLAAALMAARALASFLYLTSTRDPWVIAGSLLALAVIACAASLLPALRAARIEPMSAIRCE